MMRLKVFQTPKPKRFSFHTRYYDENKMVTEDEISVEKGSFSKYKNKFRNSAFEKENKAIEKRRRWTIFSIIIALGLVYAIFQFSNSIENLIRLIVE